MSAHSIPPPVDPNSAWAEPPQGPVPHADRAPRGVARIGLILLGFVLVVGAISWAVAIGVRLVEFLSGDCRLLGCADQTFLEHVYAYGEALVGTAGVTFAARSAWLTERLLGGHRHFVTLRRGVLTSLVLLALWSLLLGQG